jgi:PPP family 3-phenylpropionic acid transporter
MTDRSLLASKVFYFFFFGAMAVLTPFLALYYAQIGFSGTQIGFLIGLTPFITLFSASLIGAVADVTQQYRRLLMISVVGLSLMVFTISQVTSFFWLIPVVVLYALFFAPILPLVDKTVLDSLGNNKNQYGRQRLWGTVGWGLAAPAAGLVIEQTSLTWIFYICFVLLMGAFLVSTWLPVRRVNLAGHFSDGIRLLLRNWRWATFLAVAFVAGAGLAVINTYLFLLMDQLGATKTMMGLAMTVATVSEMGVMFFSDRLLMRWGTRGLLAVSLGCLALRLTAYGLIQTSQWILVIQLLHAPTFALLWIAGVAHADRLAPAGTGATAQGLFSGVTMGLGAAFGAIAGGLLYQSLGAAFMFLWAGAGVFVAFVIFVVIGQVVRHHAFNPTQ